MIRTPTQLQWIRPGVARPGQREARSGRWGCARTTSWLLAAVVLVQTILCAGSVQAVDSPTASESQIKAAYLVNFPKYLDWPLEAFAETNSPIVVGFLGESKVLPEIQKVIAGRAVNGRQLIIKQVLLNDLNGCHILFISSSEKSNADAALAQAGALPVLTVGEQDQFLQKGGTINFVMKDGKVRLEINLDAARQAKLQISSKLLSVADVVKGKAN